MLVDEIDIDRILSDVDDARLQRCVNAAERHMNRLGTISREGCIFGRGRLHADL
jgi:hypothetical protein